MGALKKDQTPSGQIIVGLSGGVDSAVAAMLLQRKGYDVRGLFMKNWEEDDSAAHCAAEKDLAAAKQVANTLNIPLDTINFSSEYWDRVFTHFLAELKAGRTPNPDILCNREIKFQAFLEYALSKGAEKIATGHYACSKRYPAHIELHRAVDTNKDQTYFLHQVSSQALIRTLFPLCRYKKPQVRKMAEEAGLTNYNRKDSTGICFIGERRFNDFITKYIPNEPGPIRSTAGKTMGQHHGLMFHTIGQRKGLGIGGHKNSHNEPWFVVSKSVSSNTLVVAQGHNHPALFAKGLSARNLYWITNPPATTSFECTARIRHRQQDRPCIVHMKDDGSCHVVFEQPVRAITPGQYVVFYNGNICMGGGTIEGALH